MTWNIDFERFNLQKHREIFFDMIPKDEHFLLNVEPLVIRRLIPEDICNNLIISHAKHKRRQSYSPNGKNASVAITLDYKNTVDVLNIDLSPALLYFNPKFLTPLVNLHWNINWNYDWIPEFKHTMYTIYDKDTYCRNHLDVIFNDVGILQRPSRRLSVLAYLNSWSIHEEVSNTFTGGELIFPSIIDELGEPFTFRPTIGDVIIFPTNPNYYHMVSRVTSGQRHTLLNALQRVYD